MILSLSSCCKKPKPVGDDDVIVVENSSIVENPDGTYTVSKGWMLKRLDAEKRLVRSLKTCLAGGDK